MVIIKYSTKLYKEHKLVFIIGQDLVAKCIYMTSDLLTDGLINHFFLRNAATILWHLDIFPFIFVLY